MLDNTERMGITDPEPEGWPPGEIQPGMESR